MTAHGPQENGNGPPPPAFFGFLLWIVVGVAGIWGVSLSFGASGREEAEKAARPAEAANAREPYDPFESLSNRILLLEQRGLYPCGERCHDRLVANVLRRKAPAEAHSDVELRHGEFVRCLDCHDAADRDRLKLINGTRVGFNESYRLCGQCHGPVYRDWKHGVHGERRGRWNGDAEWWPCVRCHDAHYPTFRPMTPLPPPRTRFQHAR